MKSFIKGFSLQLIINIFAHIIRIIVAYLIIKYAPDPSLQTSFAKDSGWQILSLFSIIGYNIISIIVSLIIFIKKDMKFLLGFEITTVLSIIYAIKFCGLWDKNYTFNINTNNHQHQIRPEFVFEHIGATTEMKAFARF